MKRWISLMVILALFVSTNLFVFASNYDKTWDFEDRKVGDNIVGDWVVLRNRYYKVQEAFGNKFLETSAAQHTDYFENMQTLSEEMKDFSAQFRVKFIEFKDPEWGTLCFYFRTQNTSNSYILWLKQNIIELVDMDQVDPKYSDLVHNRKVVDSYEHTFDYRKWYQINIVSTTVDPFTENDGGTFGKVRNQVYLNGVKILDWTDDSTWYNDSGFMFYAWDVQSQIDDIKISYNVNKYKPTGPVTPAQDEVQSTPTPKPTSSPTGGNTPTVAPTVAPTAIPTISTSQSHDSSAVETSGESSVDESSENPSTSETSEDLPSETEQGTSVSESSVSDEDSKSEPDESQSDSPQKSNIKTGIIVAAIIVIIGAAVAIYFFVIKPKA